ncbi:MAG: sigma-54-dependent Fis family transcriptional regulator [Acidobacteria bacterium]|jgi:DNA-binding NtrC family response regulator|nr:sigma-54-dependent Fis family transcriptional regulator [Acidobacteriota bacterium]
MALKKILIVDDEQMIRWVLSQALSEWSYEPIEAADIQTALELFDTEQPTLTLLDIGLPDGSGLNALRAIKLRQPDANVIMITSNVLVENVIAALRAGACDFITKPINLDELQITIRNCFESEELHIETESPLQIPPANFKFEQFIGESAAIKELLSFARKVAESNASSVLLQGESGTGKDLIAKAIHHSSARAAKPFVAINCAAIPENLIESELFGYEKGSFTDAKNLKEGLFEQAKGGTIFLDEIGELELGLQAKLLRVLEEGLFRRVGGLKDLPLNACIIAASNRNLREESETGKFRRDFYFRLSVIEIDVPPLRERGDDVLLLAAHFIKKLDRGRYQLKPRQLAPEAIKAFKQYPWDGNVRELRNAIERAVILEEGEQITLKYLPPGLSRVNGSDSFNGYPEQDGNHQIQLPAAGISLEAVEDSLIEQALQRSQGNVTRAAEILNISRDRLRYHLKKKRLKKSN